MKENLDLDVDAILTRIKAQASTGNGNGASFSKSSPPAQTSSAPPAAAVKSDDVPQLTLDRLLSFRDEEFVRVAYRSILLREPDPRGLADFLASLRAGSVTRLQVLVALRFSDEGRRAGVSVPGLTRAYWTGRLSKLPVIGHILQILYGILRLPVVIKNIAAQDAALAVQFSSVNQRNEQVRVLGEKVQNMTEVIDRLTASVERAATNAVELQQHLSRIEFAKANRKELATLEEALKSAQLASEDNHSLDSLHLALANELRGSREAVREGLKVYLPYLHKQAGAPGDCLPLLDVACGRGDWLELLHELQHPARGVDANRAAVQNCKELGLDVAEDDALAYLRKQPNNTFSTVTCFHYFEHIDHKSLVSLLDEFLRVLKPGGLAIVETPNVRNLLVSSDFYRDPTHRNPVCPETLECIAELRGFAESMAYCFDHTRSTLIPFSECPIEDWNARIKVSRDCAWIGVKPQ